MRRADEADDFWHQMIEGHRQGTGEFDGEVSLILAMALMTAATEPEGSVRSARAILLQLREWYAPRLERLSVLAWMRHIKSPESAPAHTLGRAIWDNHQELGCPDTIECSLHSFGSLWAHWRLDPPGDATSWVPLALRVLVNEHPLRHWALSLVTRAAEWVNKGAMPVTDAVDILGLAMDAGLHEHLANTELLASSWRGLVDVAPVALHSRLTQIGNKIVAAGGTCLIDTQLDLLRYERAHDEGGIDPS